MEAISPFAAALGNKLRVMRLEAELSITDVARATGLSWQQINEYELGRRKLYAERASYIAQAMGYDELTL